MSDDKPKHPGGRPTLYEERYCDEILEYFGRKPYEIKDNKTEASDFPSFAGFAAQIGVHRETMREWCDTQPKFLAAYKKAKELQENWMLVNGNRGLVNTAFGIFTAKNVLGYRDRQPDEVDRTINNFNQLSDDQLKSKLQSLLDKESEK